MDDKKKFKGLYVEVRSEGDKDANLDYALRKLKQMIKNDDLMVRIHETSHYTKPSEKRRDQRARAKARARSQTKRSNM